MTDPRLILTLALDGSRVDCIAELGQPQHVVVQQAIHLARDPDVALAHPELAGRVLERVERQRAGRLGTRLGTRPAG